MPPVLAVSSCAIFTMSPPLPRVYAAAVPTSGQVAKVPEVAAWQQTLRRKAWPLRMHPALLPPSRPHPAAMNQPPRVPQPTCRPPARPALVLPARRQPSQPAAAIATLREHPPPCLATRFPPALGPATPLGSLR